ncbi:MAG: phage antirepressor KilAC domain-containing protein [Betaproteobacteria bacterium]
MSNIVPFQKVFEYQSKQVRTVIINNEPHFVAKDVCEILEIDQSQTRRLDDDEKGLCPIQTPGGVQEMLVVNEPGLYSLILGSRKPEAKLFKRWVTHEVIPAIRRTGYYDPLGRRLPRNYTEALEELLRTEKERLALEERVEVLEPKGEMYDLLLSAKNAQTMAEVAKSFGWGRNRLFAFLRDQRILMRNNLPYQEYMDSGYFEVREVTTNRGDFSINVTQTLVTPKGIDFIGKLLKAKPKAS